MFGRTLAIVAVTIPLCGCDFLSDAVSTSASDVIPTSVTQQPESSLVTELREQRNAVLTAAFESISTNGSINDLETFLSSLESVPQHEVDDDYRTAAYERVWELTRSVDLWDGYVHFVATHENAPPELIAKANKRICELALAAAKTDGSIDAYLDFLNRFRAAPVPFRTDAIALAVDVQEMELREQIGATSGVVVDRAERATAGIRLLNQGLEAKRDHDEARFLVYAEVIRRSELFADTEAKTQLLIKEDIQDDLSQIQTSLEQLRKDVSQLRAAVLDGVKTIRDSQDHVLARVIENQEDMLKQLAEQDESPFRWDTEKSAWDIVASIGAAGLPVVAEVALGRLLRRM